MPGALRPDACRDYRYPVRIHACNTNGTIAKAADHLHQHGVDFADAIAALEDPNRLEEIDTRFAYDEERMQVIGMASRNVLYLVVTLRDENTYRIIRPERLHDMSKTGTTRVTVKRAEHLAGHQ